MIPRFVSVCAVLVAIPLLASAAPMISVRDVTLPAGQTFQVPVDGAANGGGPLTYEVVSVSDTNVTAELTAGNRSLSFLVTGKDAATNDFSGELVFQLFEDLASNTTARIISLAESNFYDGLTFHRVIDDFVAQGGDPAGNGSGGSGVEFDDEYDARLTFNGSGQLAMANSGDDSNDSQFFVTDVDLGLADGEPPPPLYLSFQHTIFGQLTSGFGALDVLIHTPVAGETPLFSPVISNAMVFADTEDAVVRVSAPTNFTGSALVTVRATDTNAASTEASFTVTVITNAPNLRAFLGALPASLVATQFVELVVPLAALDLEGDPLTVKVGVPGNLNALPAGVAAGYDPSIEALRITVNQQATGTVVLVVGLRDNIDHDGNATVDEPGAYDTQGLTLTVVANPAAPVLTVRDITVPAGQTFQVPIDGFSPVGSPLSFGIAGLTDFSLLVSLTASNRSLRLAVTGKDAATNDFSGDLVFQLFEDLTPLTTARIISLVESNFYDGLTFHEVLEDFGARGGDPNGNGTGGSGVLFDDEFDRRLAFNGFGQLAMAGAGDDANDAQILVTDADLGLGGGEPPPPLQGSFDRPIFGQLTSGFGVLATLLQTPAAGVTPVDPPVISNAVVFASAEDAVLRVTAPTNYAGTATVTVGAMDTNGVVTEASFTVTVITNTPNLRPFLGPVPASLVATQYVVLEVPLRPRDLEDDPLTVVVGVPGDLFTPPPHVTTAYDAFTGILRVTADLVFTGEVPLLIGVRDETDHDGDGMVDEADEYDTQATVLTVVAGSPGPVVAVRDIVVPAGLTFQVPLDGHSPVGSPLAYEVVSVSATNVTAALTAGNRSVRLLVTGKDAATNNFSGELVFQLFEDLTPLTTARIISLVESNFYDGLTFHRIIDDFVAQGGDPDGNGSGGSGVKFDDEYDLRASFTGYGQLAMANSGDDSNDSQFFVTDVDLSLGDPSPAKRPPEFLSFNHTVFGQLTSGFDVLDALIRTPLLGGDFPLFPPVISNAVVFVDDQDAVLRVSAPTNFTGGATITVRATDTNAASTEVTFAVTVVTNAVNLRPFLPPIPPTLVTTQSVAVNLPFSVTDFEDDPLSLLAGTPGNPGQFPPHLSASYDSETETLIFSPEPEFTGDIPILVGARDQTQREAPEQVIREYDTQAFILRILPIEGETADFVPTKGAVYNWQPGFFDHIAVQGTLSFRSNSVDGTFNALTDSVSLSFGDITNRLSVQVLAGDPRWKGKPGKAWKFKSGQFTRPRFRLIIDPAKGKWQFKCQEFFFSGVQRNPFRLTVRAGNDVSVVDTVWTEYRPGRYKLR